MLLNASREQLLRIPISAKAKKERESTSVNSENRSRRIERLKQPERAVEPSTLCGRREHVEQQNALLPFERSTKIVLREAVNETIDLLQGRMC